MTEDLLEALLEKARLHVITPQEIWDQRLSFVYGQLMDEANPRTKEQIAAAMTEEYGPRPSASGMSSEREIERHMDQTAGHRPLSSKTKPVPVETPKPFPSKALKPGWTPTV